jgi:hypothetical protein
MPLSLSASAYLPALSAVLNVCCLGKKIKCLLAGSSSAKEPYASEVRLYRGSGHGRRNGLRGSAVLVLVSVLVVLVTVLVLMFSTMGEPKIVVDAEREKTLSAAAEAEAVPS